MHTSPMLSKALSNPVHKPIMLWKVPEKMVEWTQYVLQVCTGSHGILLDSDSLCFRQSCASFGPLLLHMGSVIAGQRENQLFHGKCPKRKLYMTSLSHNPYMAPSWKTQALHYFTASLGETWVWFGGYVAAYGYPLLWRSKRWGVPWTSQGPYFSLGCPEMKTATVVKARMDLIGFVYLYGACTLLID